MVMTINGTDYQINFGVGFLRALDEKYYTETKTGIKFGMGLEVKLPMLMANDTVTLSEFLYMGTCAEKKRPSQHEVDEYIDTVDDIEDLFEKVVDELKKHNATKLSVEKMMIDLKAAEEQANRKK